MYQALLTPLIYVLIGSVIFSFVYYFFEQKSKKRLKTTPRVSYDHYDSDDDYGNEVLRKHNESVERDLAFAQNRCWHCGGERPCDCSNACPRCNSSEYYCACNI
jgi:hypothetical protein